MSTTNYLAVFVSAIAGMFFGALWYSPLLFGKIWMNLSGLSNDKLNKEKSKGMIWRYCVTFLGSLLMAFTLANLINYLPIINYSAALKLSFLVWLGFFATASLAGFLWEGKSVKLYLLNIAYYLIELLIMCLILVVWV